MAKQLFLELLHYPLLVAIVGLLIWIVVFDGLKGMGLPDVFWRYSPNASWLGGAGIAVVFTIWCFVTFLLRVDGYVALQVDWDRFALAVEPVFAILILIGYFRARTEEGTYGLSLLVSFLITSVALWFGMKALVQYASTWNPFWEAHKFLWRLLIPKAKPATLQWHTCGIIVAGIAAASYVFFASVAYKKIVSSAAICILLSVALLGYGWTVYNYGGAEVVLVIAFVLLLILADKLRPRRYRYPALAGLYSSPVHLTPPQGAPNLIPVTQSLDAWRSQFPKPPKLLIIATSGGGIRAAAWTSALLRYLQASVPDFGKHVRIVTGASGGLVGAADWVAWLTKAQGPAKPGATSIADNALDDVARALALRDIPKLFLPFSWNDRGVALEDRWCDCAPVMETKFSQLAAGERAGVLPSLIFSPMFVEDGRRLLISNLDLSGLAVASGPQLPQQQSLYSIRAVQMFELFPQAQDMMRLATAARMNASFPYVGPAAELPTLPRRHIVDAGYYDNFGISTATAFIAENATWLAKKDRRRRNHRNPRQQLARKPLQPGPAAGLGDGERIWRADGASDRRHQFRSYGAGVSQRQRRTESRGTRRAA